MFHPSITVHSYLNTIKTHRLLFHKHSPPLHTTQRTLVVVCARAEEAWHQRPAMKSSSAAPGLRLKQEQASDGSSLELRLGISSDNGGGGDDPWLGVGVHPWSLASRQEKAALEQQAQQRQPVGWPPVGAFRKSHLAGAAKAAEEPSKEKRGGSGEASLFVKVNLEGCAVGRKVDLQAHRGYASLSRALQGMFHGLFLSDGQWSIAGRDDDDEPAKKSRTKTYILLYEDNEGDRMLVGDVPWELFMASVKRLYIAQDPRKKKKN